MPLFDWVRSLFEFDSSHHGHSAAPPGFPEHASDSNALIQAIKAARRGGNLEALRGLLSEGVDPNEFYHGELPLNICCEWLVNGQLEAAKILLEAGADVNGEDKFGTPLILATRQVNSKLVKALLEAGAGPNQEFKGQTALKWAIYTRSAPVTRLLLEAGADASKLRDYDIPNLFKAEFKRIKRDVRLRRQWAVATLGHAQNWLESGKGHALPSLPREMYVEIGKMAGVNLWTGKETMAAFGGRCVDWTLVDSDSIPKK